jgi:predicted transcriptional regulator
LLVDFSLTDLHIHAVEANTRNQAAGRLEHRRIDVIKEERTPIERRDKLDILLAILEITRQPVKKTHILYTAKINFFQLTKYLDLLLAIGMVEVVSTPFEGYLITEKGRLLINLFGHGSS